MELSEFNSDLNLTRFLKSENIKREELSFSATSDLMDILVDDFGLNSTGSPCDLYTYLYTTRFPLLNRHSSISLQHFEFDRSLSQVTLKNHSDIVEVVKDYFQNEKIQIYLREASARFITEYLDASQSLPFSVADIWSLKEKYLKELHTIIREQEEFQGKNRFYREDSLWVLSYEGKTIRLKDLKGFAYMQFLVSKKNKDYSYIELHNLFGAEGQIVEGEEEKLKKQGMRVTDGRSKVRDKGIWRWTPLVGQPDGWDKL